MSPPRHLIEKVSRVRETEKNDTTSTLALDGTLPRNDLRRAPGRTEGREADLSYLIGKHHQPGDAAVLLARFGLLFYVDLWVLEGAIRKWVPGTDSILYIARDAFTTGILVSVLLARRRRSRPTWWFWALSLLLLMIGVAHTWANLTTASVMLVGLRSYLAPLLPVVLLALVPDAVDLPRLSRRILFYMPLQVVLASLQVTTSVGSFWNAQVNGEDTRFENLGISRVTGTFSAPLGFQSFVLIALALSIAVLVDRQSSRTLAILAATSAVIGVAISGSRGTVFGAAVILLVLLYFCAAARDSRSLKIVFVVGVLISAVAIAVQVFFKQVLNALFYRFETASAAENTGARLLESALGFVDDIVNPFGVGIGVHSQAGIALGSPGPWIESDPERWVAELGVVGLIMALVAKATAVWLIVRLITAPRTFSAAHALLVAVATPILLVGQITVSPSAQAAFGVTVALILLSRPRPDHETVGRQGTRPRFHSLAR